MTKIVAWLALGFSLVACVAVPVYMQQQTQAAIDRALRQREAQIMQRYLALINELGDTSSEAAALKQARTLEELLDGFVKIVRTELARRHDNATAINQIAAQEVAMIREATAQPQFGGDGESHQPARRNANRGPNTKQPAAAAASIPALPASSSAAPKFTDGEDAPLSGRIVFVAADKDKSEIFLINADGSDRRQLTRNENDEFCPTWDPSGKSIAYMADENDATRIFIMNVSKREPQPLLTPSEPERNRGIAWSPDGTQLAFAGKSDSIIVVDVAGHEERTLVEDGTSPAWSPDGKQLVFVRKSRLAMVNADGSGFEYMEPKDDSNHGTFPVGSLPRWSPDGTRILFNFISSKTDQHGHASRSMIRIGVLYVASRRIDRLDQAADYEWGLDWSPDGQHILLLSGDNDRNSLRLSTSRVDGSHRRVLTDKRPIGFWASWAPSPDEMTLQSIRHR